MGTKHRNILDYVGQKFGRLTVTNETRKVLDKKKNVWRTQVKCICDCGNEKWAKPVSLFNGDCTSCGCRYAETKKELGQRRHSGEIYSPGNYRHGLKDSRLYSIWANMKTRCHNPKSTNYKWYGAKGISVCDEWLTDFKKFYDWSMSHGYRDDLELDRINSDFNYTPSNCRWITHHDQVLNQNRVILIRYNNEVKPRERWAEEFNLYSDMMARRMQLTNFFGDVINAPAEYGSGPFFRENFYRGEHIPPFIFKGDPIPRYSYGCYQDTDETLNTKYERVKFTALEGK